MEIIINLKRDCLHCKDMSVYDHNVYLLNESLLWFDYIKVNYYEASNNYDVAIGKENDEGVFVGEYFYDADVTDHGSRLVVYIN
ncbi:MAG: hypothetical protein GY861_10865 [bacterium]|nr:hypothetical protein [bacterium]